MVVMVGEKEKGRETFELVLQTVELQHNRV